MWVRGESGGEFQTIAALASLDEQLKGKRCGDAGAVERGCLAGSARNQRETGDVFSNANTNATVDCQFLIGSNCAVLSIRLQVQARFGGQTTELSQNRDVGLVYISVYGVRSKKYAIQKYAESKTQTTRTQKIVLSVSSSVQVQMAMYTRPFFNFRTLAGSYVYTNFSQYRRLYGQGTYAPWRQQRGRRKGVR